ncbi:GPI transamidase component PIG-T [Hypsibius exemplaris]|uniref:GPI transamidase component PIG-T n=1 Tax=Hypsibius exemplaris TaxID=2072580 RepID=A0A9X6NIU4_HYPEX|nr:GPI transamidase component PIG-T [Hypsibius exemplaris]
MRGAFLFSVLIGVVLAVSASEKRVSDTSSEELFISPLKTGHVYLHFKFASSTPLKAHYAHTDYLPKPVVDILEKHSVDELHVRLTQGVFRHSKWGYPILSAPTGGEVWAWFKPDAEGLPEKWKGLTNSLSGLLCATFSKIDTANSLSPKWNFRPEGLVPGGNLNSSLSRYSMLPGENVCTENLTPWKKLLPCSDRAGLGRLLNSIKLLSAHYFSLSLDVTPVCADVACSQKRLAIEITATAVVAPGSLQDTNQLNWSIRDLLEMDLDTGCPLTDKSHILVDQSSQGQMVFWPSSTFTLTHSPSAKGRIAVYDLKHNQTWEKSRGLGGKSTARLEHGTERQPIISAHRFVAGYGQQNGGIRCVIENTHPTAAITVSYLEMLPWFLRVYFHTIRVKSLVDGRPIPLLKSHFGPGRDRLAPHHIEVIFTIPAATTVEFGVDFDFTLLKWTEYPPDAHRGFDVPPAVIGVKLDQPGGQCGDFIFPAEFSQLGGGQMRDTATASSDGQKRDTATASSDGQMRDTATASGCFLRLYTEPLLVSLPTPDFSMPYNVICMTCTVLALAFGPIHALTTKNFKLIDLAENPPLLERVKRKGQLLLTKFRKTPPAVVVVAAEEEDDQQPDVHDEDVKNSDSE